MVKADTPLLPCVVLFVCFGNNTRVSAETCNLVTRHVFMVKTGRTFQSQGEDGYCL